METSLGINKAFTTLLKAALNCFELGENTGRIQGGDATEPSSFCQKTVKKASAANIAVKHCRFCCQATARKDGAIKTMHAVGLDIDSGAALDDVVKKLETKGLFAVVYSSFRAMREFG